MNDTEGQPSPAQMTNSASSQKLSNKRSVAVPTLCILLLAAVVWAVNFSLVSHPISQELDEDPRNSGYVVKAHYRYYLDPSTLILDLTKATNVSPVDLFRAVFQSARVLRNKGRRFERVILSRSGKPIFLMKGNAFLALGNEIEEGQNPVYLIRTLPESLLKPNGESAFSKWEGGWLGVMGKQLDDANDAARRWVQGESIP